MPIVAAAAITAGGALLANRSQSKAAQQSAQASQYATDQAVAEQRRQYDLSRSDYAPYLQTGTAALQQLGGLYGLNSGAQGAAMTQAYPTGQAGGSASYGALAGMGRGRGITTMDENGQPVIDRQMRGYGLPPTEAAQAGTTQVGQAVAVPQAGPGAPNSAFWQSPDYNFRLNESMRALTARNAALGIQDSGSAQRSALTLAGNQASGEFNNYANRLAALAGVGQTAAQNNASLGQSFAGNFGNLVTNNAQNLASSYQTQGQANAGNWTALAGLGSGLVNNLWPAR